MKQHLEPSIVLMIEQAIKKSKDYPTKRQLEIALPKITQQTLKLALKHIEDSGKIIIKDGRIIWIFNDNPKFLKMLKKSIIYKN